MVNSGEKVLVGSSFCLYLPLFSSVWFVSARSLWSLSNQMLLYTLQYWEGPASRHGLLSMCCSIRKPPDFVWGGEHSAGGWVHLSVAWHTKRHLTKDRHTSSECCNLFHLDCWKSRESDSANSLTGLPHFSVEPQHMSVVANVTLSLSCVAHGPPEPVRVIWLQDGAPLNSLADPVALSPSTLNLTGITYNIPILYWYSPIFSYK